MRHFRRLHVISIQFILLYRRKWPKYIIPSQSGGIAGNRKPHTELCRSKRSPAVTIPDKWLLRYFGILHHSLFNRSRNEIDESIRNQSMEMVRIMHSFNDMVLHYFRICIWRSFRRLVPLPGRITWIQCKPMDLFSGRSFWTYSYIAGNRNTDWRIFY